MSEENKQEEVQETEQEEQEAPEEEEESQEEETSEQEDSEESSEESVDELKQRLEKEKKAREKAEKAIAKNKRKEKKEKSKKVDYKQVDDDSDEDIKEEIQELKLAERKRQFGYRNNLSPEEVDKVFEVSSNPSEETLQDPFVKEGLKGLRREKNKAENTPSSSVKANPLKDPKFEELTQAQKDKKLQEYLKSKSGNK